MPNNLAIQDFANSSVFFWWISKLSKFLNFKRLNSDTPKPFQGPCDTSQKNGRFSCYWIFFFKKRQTIFRQISWLMNQKLAKVIEIYPCFSLINLISFHWSFFICTCHAELCRRTMIGKHEQKPYNFPEKISMSFLLLYTDKSFAGTVLSILKFLVYWSLLGFKPTPVCQVH